MVKSTINTVFDAERAELKGILEHIKQFSNLLPISISNIVYNKLWSFLYIDQISDLKHGFHGVDQFSPLFFLDIHSFELFEYTFQDMNISEVFAVFLAVSHMHSHPFDSLLPLTQHSPIIGRVCENIPQNSFTSCAY